jgi:hypothetical protein
MEQEVKQNEDPVAAVHLVLGDPVASDRDFLCNESGQPGAGSLSVRVYCW